MAATSVERGRITARVTAYAQQTIETAAQMAATTVSQFVAQAALREAERVIEEEGILRLVREDFEKVLQALDKPAAASPRLAASFDHFWEAMHGPRSANSPLKWEP